MRPSWQIGRAGVVVVLCGLLAACDDAPQPATVEAPVTAAYVGSDDCRACHASQFSDWQGSHHFDAMQPASNESVVGDFDGTSFDYAGIRYEFWRDGDSFRVSADDAQGEIREFEVSHTFGIEPLQQYLVSFADGRKQALSVAWDTREKTDGGQRWFHLYPDDGVTASDPLHWTGRGQNWNFMCADCHSTDLRKNYDHASRSFDTTWADVTVGCESCHGPGSRHIENMRRGLLGQTALTPALGTQRGEIETCARCHSRRGILAEGFEPGDAFLDHYRPSLLDDGLYHADGQILDEVYVYGSFLQSKMYQQGVVCSDCHNPHKASLDIGGNGTCTACHSTEPPARFPTLTAKTYDHPDHHFHTPGSDAAQCVSCHMPSKTYMVVDDRRDHSFRLPRPDLSASTGAPNTCNACHSDRDASWAADEIAERFGDERPEHFGPTLAAGRQQQTGATTRLAALAGDTTLPGIVRATALSLMRSNTPDMAALAAGLSDPDPLVRLGAIDGVSSLQIRERWQLANHLLDDELLAVRTAAAESLASIVEESVLQADLRRLEAAVNEYVATQELNADRPEAWTNLGVLFSGMGDASRSENAYVDALTLDEQWLPARINLADLYRSQGRDSDAARQLVRAREIAPDNADIRYAWGLSLVRQQRRDDALAEFEAAARLAPRNAQYAFAYGIALNSMGQPRAAVSHLSSSLERFPDNTDILFALATIERDRGNIAAAIGYADRLLERQPGDSQWLNLRRQLAGMTE